MILTICASRQVKARGTGLCWIQFVGAVAIAGALFPYVSATDDLVWMENLSSRTEHQEGRNAGTSNASSSLLALYHAGEAFLISRNIRIACVFVFLAMTLALVIRSFDCSRVHASGRSPPAFAAV